MRQSVGMTIKAGLGNKSKNSTNVKQLHVRTSRRTTLFVCLSAESHELDAGKKQQLRK